MKMHSYWDYTVILIDLQSRPRKYSTHQPKQRAKGENTWNLYCSKPKITTLSNETTSGKGKYECTKENDK